MQSIHKELTVLRISGIGSPLSELYLDVEFVALVLSLPAPYILREEAMGIFEIKDILTWELL